MLIQSLGVSQHVLVFPFPPTLHHILHFRSAAVTSLEDIRVPRHQESPLLHRQSCIHGGIALLFHFVCVSVCALDNVIRNFTVVQGNVWNNIGSCLPEWKLRTVRWDQCEDDRLICHARIILTVGLVYLSISVNLQCAVIWKKKKYCWSLCVSLPVMTTVTTLNNNNIIDQLPNYSAALSSPEGLFRA